MNTHSLSCSIYPSKSLDIYFAYSIVKCINYNACLIIWRKKKYPYMFLTTWQTGKGNHKMMKREEWNQFGYVRTELEVHLLVKGITKRSLIVPTSTWLASSHFPLSFIFLFLHIYSYALPLKSFWVPQRTAVNSEIFSWCYVLFSEKKFRTYTFFT